MTKALIFDFDGLILDTEVPDYESWQSVYARYGQDLPMSLWGQVVGGDGGSDFDPHTYLEKLTEQSLDREEVWISRRTAYLDTVAQQPIMPGVEDYLARAQARGLKLGVASSSPENWVHGHLNRLGLFECFDAIRTADDVARTKPDPALYLGALEALRVSAEEAVVFEDSANGVQAAKAAGIYTVAVPNEITRQLEIVGADLRLNSLAELPLEDLLARVQNA